MLKCEWDAFYSLHGGVVSRLHVFPASRRVSAPYPVSLRLASFADGVIAGPIRIEGCRLHQPVTVELGATFPQFVGSEFVGLEISLVSSQASIDLESTSIFLEIASSSTSATYIPARRKSKSERLIHAERATKPSQLLLSNSARSESVAPVQLGAKKTDLHVKPNSCRVIDLPLEDIKPLPDIPQGHVSVEARAYCSSFFLYREGIKGHLVAVEAV